MMEEARRGRVVLAMSFPFMIIITFTIGSDYMKAGWNSIWRCQCTREWLI